MIAPGSVKICSLRRPEHAQYVVAAGADLFGLIFVDSAWRHVTPQLGRAIVDEVRLLGGGKSIGSVGVFVDAEIDAINRIAEVAALDYVQIHVPDHALDWRRIERPIIPVLRPVPGATGEEVSDKIVDLGFQSDNIAAILIDTYNPNAKGGTGEIGDWNMTRYIYSVHPIGLAGGLSSDNVASAIQVVRPFLVDVSSGVETDREKDPAKIRAFVRNARQAFSDLLIRQVDDVPVG